MTNQLFETCKNYVMPHGKNIFQTEYDTDIEKICAYPSSKYALLNWKCVFCCCAQCSCIDLPS